MFLTIILFIIGFVLLIKGADILVDGASSIAFKWGVSSLVIGLTIVAFGTSAPELVVNLLASINGNTELAIGNILGSNTSNILLILGISAIIYPLVVNKGTTWKEIPFAFLGVVVLFFLVTDRTIDTDAWMGISRMDGLVLLSFFIIFLYYIFGIAKQTNDGKEQEKPKIYSNSRSVLMIIFGMTGLVLGGKWIVDGAISFATYFELSEALIGLTVVAIGTSLPELATSAVAAYKKNVDIAIGNIVGSNIFNIFWILGISSVIAPIPFSSELIFDLFVTSIATTFLFFALFVGKKLTIQRSQGVLFVILYIIYIIYLVIRG
jgi:cation:H+ antiporter